MQKYNYFLEIQTDGKIILLKSNFLIMKGVKVNIFYVNEKHDLTIFAFTPTASMYYCMLW